MNAQLDPGLLEKLKALPAERRAEVADFVDFLSTKERAQAVKEFLAISEQVARAGVPPLSPEDIEAELAALRAERRRHSSAGR